MKDNFIHVCFIIDASGSMYDSKEDVTGGFKTIIDEQKKEKNGQCAISLYTFEDKVHKKYLGKDVNEIDKLDYVPSGCTAMYDGIGTAITEVGKWLNSMKEEDRPSKNLIVIMTDGFENASKEYTLNQIKDMIKHQEDVYNWTFQYVGCNVTESKEADKMGFKNSTFVSRDNYGKSWDTLNCATKLYRCSNASVACATMDSFIQSEYNKLTEEYEQELGKKIKNTK